MELEIRDIGRSIRPMLALKSDNGPGLIARAGSRRKYSGSSTVGRCDACSHRREDNDYGSGLVCCCVVSRMLVYRAGNVTLWDFEQDKASSWGRLRPDCWISTIPACGLILSPEAGGGCSCGVWMETSIAFRPKQRE